jgi:hypothetical protein
VCSWLLSLLLFPSDVFPCVDHHRMERNTVKRAEFDRCPAACYLQVVALEIKAPNPFPAPYPKDKSFKVFLGGSIEQDKASQWQKRVVRMFKDYPGIIILNPRRDSWDPSWKNVASNKKFRQQVEWELDALDASDAILMYFDPKTKSPISLLETGLYAKDRGYVPAQWEDYEDGMTVRRMDPYSVLHVVCPRGFWRKGNVDIVCERHKIQRFSSITKAVNNIKRLYELQKGTD